jgi:DNA ligase D-like protein (predicted 3'-phosphoesterase)
MPRFVIQRHQARSLHYDFRLEHDGVFKSWAIPKGMPTEVGVRRLAMQTADHELVFGDFQGTILPGEYGAGTIEIWDRGNFTEIVWSDEAITVLLQGAIVTGRYTLVLFPRRGDRAWLLFKLAEQLP